MYVLYRFILDHFANTPDNRIFKQIYDYHKNGSDEIKDLMGSTGESLARAFHVKDFKERTPAEQKALFIRICTWRDYAQCIGWFHEWLKAVGVMDPKRFAEGGKFKAAPRSINLKIVEEGLRWLSSL